MATFINGDVEEGIESVPGIGPAAAASLAKVCAATAGSPGCCLLRGLTNVTVAPGRCQQHLPADWQVPEPARQWYGVPCACYVRLLPSHVCWWLCGCFFAGMSVQDHLDAFLAFIIETGIKNYRHGIVLAIAEKVATMIPDLYDAEVFGGEHK